MSKVYKSKSGREFSIVTFPKQAEGNVVYFTRAEFDWIKSQNISTEEFEYLWLLKKENCYSEIVPEIDPEKRKSLAQKYCAQIREMLTNGKVPESEN